jgi:hypothetical protein
MTTSQIEQSWKDFVIQAQAVYPLFADEKVIKAVLKSRGETSFKPEYTDKFINVLKSTMNDWQTFLKDASAIDSEFGNDKTVAKILYSRGIPWYKDFDATNGLNALKDWQTEKIKATKSWDYLCPVCGKLTVRDQKNDYMYRKECNGLGWKCIDGGYAHFHQAAWNPLRKKLVYSEPNYEVSL